MESIEIFREDDRLTVAQILVRNGYTVRQTKRRPDGKRTYLYFIEYEKPEKGKRVNEDDQTEVAD